MIFATQMPEMRQPQIIYCIYEDKPYPKRH